MKCSSTADLATSNMQCPTYQMCRSSCPDSFYSYYTHTLLSVTAWSAATTVTPLPLRDWNCDDCPDCINCLNIDEIICKPQVQAKFNDLLGREDIDVAGELNLMFLDGDCAPYYYPSAPSLGRCMPTLSSDADTANGELVDGEVQISDNANDILTFDELNDSYTELLRSEANDFLAKSLADLQESWPVILINLGVATIISFIWIFLMRWLAAPLIWIFIFGLLGLMGFGLYFCYDKYIALSNTDPAEVVEIETLLQQYTFDFQMYLEVKEVWLGFLIVLGVISLIYLLLLIFFIKRIRIATRLIGEASKAVGAIMTTLIFPLFTAVFHILVLFYWGATAAYIASSSTPVFKTFNTSEQTPNSLPVYGDDCNINEWNNETHEFFNESGITCQFVQYVGDYGWTNSTIVVQFVNLFGFYWMMNFVTAFGQCTLAGAFASWYFSFKKPDDVPALPLLSAFMRSFWHVGTLAFGSLLIAIVQLLRAILDYIDRKTKETQNSVGRCVLCFCKCCLWCLEKCIRYISKNAYILSAMFGYNFCKSSCKVCLTNIR